MKIIRNIKKAPAPELCTVKAGGANIHSSPSMEHYMEMTTGIRRWFLSLPPRGTRPAPARKIIRKPVNGEAPVQTELKLVSTPKRIIRREAPAPEPVPVRIIRRK